jgi:hypothetical protein
MDITKIKNKQEHIIDNNDVHEYIDKYIDNIAINIKDLMISFENKYHLLIDRMYEENKNAMLKKYDDQKEMDKNIFTMYINKFCYRDKLKNQNKIFLSNMLNNINNSIIEIKNNSFNDNENCDKISNSWLAISSVSKKEDSNIEILTVKNKYALLNVLNDGIRNITYFDYLNNEYNLITKCEYNGKSVYAEMNGLFLNIYKDQGKIMFKITKNNVLICSGNLTSLLVSSSTWVFNLYNFKLCNSVNLDTCSLFSAYLTKTITVQNDLYYIQMLLVIHDTKTLINYLGCVNFCFKAHSVFSKEPLFNQYYNLSDIEEGKHIIIDYNNDYILLQIDQLIYHLDSIFLDEECLSIDYSVCLRVHKPLYNESFITSTLENNNLIILKRNDSNDLFNLQIKYKISKEFEIQIDNYNFLKTVKFMKFYENCLFLFH